MHIIIIIIAVIKICRSYVSVELSKALSLFQSIAYATSMLTLLLCDHISWTAGTAYWHLFHNDVKVSLRNAASMLVLYMRTGTCFQKTTASRYSAAYFANHYGI